ncbi:hypothetical protein N7G274_001444 [Stereocaulon virgatum]|uniref:Uncharacterized protein n=1 Tax=Stereocaulon virgatum TaxID=373712 RepID=A0ABR4AJP0_9LECA
MQLALRDKEELLVQKALERIRRAQMLGKTNVKLTQPELDALQRKRRKELTTKEQARRRSSASDLKGSNRRRSSGQSNNGLKDQKSGKRKSKGYFSGYDGESSSSSRRATPPGIFVPGATGVPAFSPLGYYPPTTVSQGRSPDSVLRSASSHSLARDSLPLPRPGKQRYSGPEPSQPSPKPRSPPFRSLPDDLNWTPRSRSSSSATTPPYPTDPSYYQAYSPPLPQLLGQHVQGRRIVSSPQPDIHYPRTRAELQARSSEHLQRRGYSNGDTSDASDSEEGTASDDDGNGVQVRAVSHGPDYGFNVRPESSARGRPRRGQR